ncbi:MAG: FtsQ-type POTRA domain-containing protein [Firmicutes bacterium]|nr:FtsQ-type POTRA domain-containing protein [Bacillota bacterium]
MYKPRWRLALILLLVAAVAGGVLFSPLFRLHGILFRGDPLPTQMQSRLKEGPWAMKRYLWQVNTRQAEEEVRQLPGVTAANVSQKWPDQLEIEVHLAPTIGWIRSGGQRYRVLGDGSLVQTSVDGPQLTGITVREKKIFPQTSVRQYAVSVEPIRSVALTQFATADLSDPRNVVVTLHNGDRLHFQAADWKRSWDHYLSVKKSGSFAPGSIFYLGNRTVTVADPQSDRAQAQ